MRKLEEISSTLLKNEILTLAEACQIKGGKKKNDDKRRPRPGGSKNNPNID